MLPIGPLALSGYSVKSLNKGLFPVTMSLHFVDHAGDVVYLLGFLVGQILWGFATAWFVIRESDHSVVERVSI
jgi:hypothetical protein